MSSRVWMILLSLVIYQTLTTQQSNVYSGYFTPLKGHIRSTDIEAAINCALNCLRKQNCEMIVLHPSRCKTREKAINNAKYFAMERRDVSYNSQYWTNKTSLNTMRGLDLAEYTTVLPTYWSTPLTKVCVGMKHPGLNISTAKWLKLTLKSGARSLLDVITGNNSQPFQVLGDTAWRTSFSSNLTYSNEKAEGINLEHDSAFARIGMVGNVNVKYFSSSSFSGLGTWDKWFPSKKDDISCGYGYSGYVDTKRYPFFCYIFVS